MEQSTTTNHRANNGRWNKVASAAGYVEPKSSAPKNEMAKSNRWKKHGWQEVSWQLRKEDWKVHSGELDFCHDPLSLSNMMDAQNDGKWLALIHRPEIAQEMLQLVPDSHLGGLTIVFPGDNKQQLPPELESWQGKATRCKIPGRLQGRVNMRHAWLISLGQQPPSLKVKMAKAIELKDLKSVSKAPMNDRKAHQAGTFVLRFRTAWSYSKTYWNKIEKKPGQHARAWAMEINGVSPWKCMDTWGFVSTGKWNNEIKGMMRVQDADTAQALLHASGSSSNGQEEPWFVELVGNPESLPATKLLWLDWRDDEKWNEYRERATRETSLGVVLGDHQLGIRITANDKRYKITARKWRLQGVPAQFGPDQVQELLTSMAFTDARITGRGRQRARNIWYFEAIHQQEGVIIQSDVKISDQETMELVAVQETARRSKIPDKPLHRESRVSYNHQTESCKYPDVTKTSTSQHAAQGEAVPMSTEAVSGEKRNSDEAPDAQAKKAKPAPWFPVTGQIVRNIGGGDCLWHALAAALSTEQPNKVRTHRQVRAFTHSYMKRYSDHFRTIWEEQGKFDARGNPSQNTWEHYLDQQAKTSTWSGALEINAFCNAQNRRIMVVADDGTIYPFFESAPGDPIMLYWQKSGHFEWISQADESEWLEAKASQCETAQEQHRTLMRGGGLSSFASSKCKSPSHSARKHVIQGSAKRSHLPMSHFASPRITDFASTQRALQTPQPHGPARGSQTPLRRLVGKQSLQEASHQQTPDREAAKGPFVWTCNKCQWEVVALSWRARTKARTNHIAMAHKGVPSSEFHSLKQQRKIFVNDCPWHQRAWTCATCRLGIANTHTLVYPCGQQPKHTSKNAVSKPCVKIVLPCLRLSSPRSN